MRDLMLSIYIIRKVNSSYIFFPNASLQNAESAIQKRNFAFMLLTLQLIDGHCHMYAD